MAPIALFVLIFMLSTIGGGLSTWLSNRAEPKPSRISGLARKALASRKATKASKADKAAAAEPTYNPAFKMDQDWSHYDTPSYERMSKQWQLFDDNES